MLRPLWNGLPENLANLSAELQKVFSPGLNRWVQTLRNRGTPSTFKVINDPIWFTIRLESWELAILDSPLIQRLRGIRQLGLAGLVYPAAGYSRFEHTIGALYQTQRLIESINKNARAHSVRHRVNLEEPISHGDEALLRLAAILHDVGHGFLSHVSERALARLQIAGVYMESLRLDAKKYFGSPSRPAVAEILSALVLLLPEFRELLEVAQVPSWESKEDELAISLAKLVVRGRFSDRPFMNEIISGAFDADKLDYMPRDCYMAGLAMPIDVERLIEKVCVVNLPGDQPVVDEYVKEMNLSRTQNVQVLAIQQGGAKVFEDLVVSRVLLYDKLYNHQKVRAMEGAVVSALELLQRYHPLFSALSTYLTLSDSEFLECRWPVPTGESQARETEIARKIIQDVQQRLFDRAIAFGPELITDFDSKSKQDQRALRAAWRRLAEVISREAWSDPQGKAMQFRAKVAEKAREYLRTAGQPALAEQLHDSHLIIDLPDVQGIAKKTRSFVGDENSGIRKFNELFRVEKWAEAYENQKIAGYVFCPRDYTIAVYLAFRDLVREEFRLSFEHWSWSLTKINLVDLEKTANELISRGIKTSPAPLPPDYRERQKYLIGRDANLNVIGPYAGVIEELADRFKSFQSQDEVTKHRIHDWLFQFQRDEIALAIKVLQHVRYWDRPAITDAFSLALSDWSREDVEDGKWIALGGATTSSNHLNYLWPDLKNEGNCPKNILQSASELHNGKTIVFYDDNVGSGGQAITVLKQWMGQPPESWPLNEVHVEALDANALQVLRTARIKFLFATGRREGLKKLIESAKQLLGNDMIEGHIVRPEEISCFRAASTIFGNKSSAKMAELAFRAAGMKALSDKEEEWGEKKTSERLLGYGNHGGLNVFYYNVPTTTITALWKSSLKEGGNWLALFPRRPRD